ncbi:(2Fe-2S)-binding protein [Sphingomonas sp. 37zxx]|uniref:(2Fe-2S)-binding protein n=1 Tax=Sphingomonas sp. 37zxx TaxID=1550073 RepID=UPI00053BE370|nr:(2Fe-2S)-binding protein [Sphingomonas sp. 37zxx]
MTRLTVNNQPVQYRLDPATPLLFALRDASNLTGTKFGCGTGECGACTVDIDGQAVRSCRITLAAVEGTFVTTIEGLSRDRGHPVQQAFLASNLSQCGFCIPGMVMAAAALIRRDRDPSDDTIRAAMTNLCRCGIHPRLLEAVRRAARIARGDENVVPIASPDIEPADAARTVPALAPPPATAPES